jgi:hypothetical protein
MPSILSLIFFLLSSKSSAFFDFRKQTANLSLFESGSSSLNYKVVGTSLSNANDLGILFLLAKGMITVWGLFTNEEVKNQ